MVRLQEDLGILLKTACKPQQKLFMLNQYLLPKYYHSFIFSRLTAGALNKIDEVIRKFVRKIIHLPHDLPKAPFHAKVADGGLGVPSYRFTIPLIAKRRLTYRCPNEELLYIDHKHINSVNQIHNYFKKKLYSACAGAGLRGSSLCSPAHAWVSDGSSFLTGRDFVKAIQVRFGCLYNRARCARGRSENSKHCRRGCKTPETLNHILQQCHSTHTARIKRHDNIVKYLNKI